ncbi:DUF2550 family protein [Ornithinimicrobium sediminis]|uniref:DUF2550 family protein n=1 Tax=Ornithinimicrobium sediminis TaxID=2904603 RepID=UPI001E364A43|nr:DUF2550 family protein [Ornithinimicrobium sediminis]MCE0485568.1 DUF2550 domain-containing protein [Ornithinimicrobium sediminis]
MTDALPSVLLVVMAILAAVVLVGLGWWAFSRFAGPPHSASQPITCGYRAAEDDPWAVGVLHYEGDLLVHRRPGGLSMTTQHRWARVGLDLGFADQVDGRDVSDRLPDVPLMAVPCRYGATSFWLALTEEHYTALRAWVEAAPPGWNSNVA